jgi:hypothetical protein
MSAPRENASAIARSELAAAPSAPVSLLPRLPQPRQRRSRWPLRRMERRRRPTSKPLRSHLRTVTRLRLRRSSTQASCSRCTLRGRRAPRARRARPSRRRYRSRCLRCPQRRPAGRRRRSRCLRCPQRRSASRRRLARAHRRSARRARSRRIPRRNPPRRRAPSGRRRWRCPAHRRPRIRLGLQIHVRVPSRVPSRSSEGLPDPRGM